jgi:hypothetical protein
VPARKLWIILAWVCLLGGGLVGLSVINGLPGRAPEAKIATTTGPTEAEFKALKARVQLLEDWAIRHGGRM